MNEIERIQNLLQKLNLLLTPDTEKVSTSKSQNLKDLEDFQDYPELKAFYIKSDGTTLNNLSAIRGDGFCSIWSILVGWSLLDNKKGKNLFENSIYENEGLINFVKCQEQCNPKKLSYIWSRINYIINNR